MANHWAGPRITPNREFRQIANFCPLYWMEAVQCQNRREAPLGLGTSRESKPRPRGLAGGSRRPWPAGVEMKMPATVGRRWKECA
jgi:hypothetical protein